MDLATIVLSLSLLGSTIADVETTRYAISHGAHEINPVMRPFADSRAGMYTIKGSMNLGVAVLSHRMRHWPRDRRAWKLYRVLGWALPVLWIASQSAAAAHNSRR